MIKTTLDYMAEIADYQTQVIDFNNKIHESLVAAGDQYSDDEEIMYCVKAIESAYFFIKIGQEAESVAIIYVEAASKLLELLENKIGMA
jgi:hypothetical protein